MQKILTTSVLLVLTSGCGWVDSTGRQSNANPTLEGVITGTERSKLSLAQLKDPEGDDIITLSIDDNPSPSTSALSTTDVQSRCGTEVNPSLATNDLRQACHPSVAEEACLLSVEKDEETGEHWLQVPALRKPYVGTHTLRGSDHFGQAFSLSAELCLNSVAEVPEPRADVYQVAFNETALVGAATVYRDTVQCEPTAIDGIEGVLNNDSDDADITENCLTAEFVSFIRAPKSPSDLNLNNFARGGFSFTPGGQYLPGEVVSFTYRANDGVNASEPVTVSIHITGENQAPQAFDDSFVSNDSLMAVTHSGVVGDTTTYNFSVLDNDIDPDNLPLRVSGLLNPLTQSYQSEDLVLEKGTLSINEAQNAVLFAPTTNTAVTQFGALSFSYQISDVGGLQDDASVTASVNDRPRPSAVIGPQSLVAGGTVVNVPVTLVDGDDAGADLQVETTIDPSTTQLSAQWTWLDQTAKQGQVALSAPLSANGLAAQVTLTVRDGGVNDPGVGQSQSQFVVNMGANQVPVIDGELLVGNATPQLPFSNVLVNAGGDSVGKVFQVTDDETHVTLQYLLTSSNLAALPAANMSVDASGANPVLNVSMPATVADGTNSEVTLVVQDTALQSSVAQRFTVIANAAPTVSAITDLTASLSVAAAPWSVQLSVADEALETVQLSATSGDQTLVADSGISVSAIDTTTGQVALTITPESGVVTGTVQLNVEVRDALNRTSTVPLTLNISS